MSYTEWRGGARPASWVGFGGPAGSALGILGLALALANSQAIANEVMNDANMYAEDRCKRSADGDAFAYADLLDMRQNLNSLAPFAGDVAMSGVIDQWK